MERKLASRHQCVCCGGMIEEIVDDEAIGLDVRIGLLRMSAGSSATNAPQA
ncbi:hypothetical protein ABIF38_008414 [Bradyrhizobium japonicum]|jgi:hypothetical protein|uniref:Transposase n=1 Tax=Bradyrhizobium elkanii TaxID=29448 RepID=A0ABV4EV44_BRAEL|nr:hypothetical protein [Bradyrhizobium elkanii]MBP2428510.1 hypothetical protein [Bradyrhizobium elkanii]MCP1729272.1 hypothetical protein [Bradyrhizobium elkanii]MCP1756006.1 hypothetical protein [Bradyrhizobium elkanii]MCP1981521.1 hypothetical protein [Bradyrhizobium elkanii]MCS3573401.1 hypothetical protein [Bradyrhizobium elkanii]